jgi:hypothetical protein
MACKIYNEVNKIKGKRGRYFWMGSIKQTNKIWKIYTSFSQQIKKAYTKTCFEKRCSLNQY